ncbi:MAG TPA: hypothetical protein VFC73_09250 [Syntrophomonadaceae bacterium]|nr:hypothetical protein [Syntrophomonadaceae bacterium]
MGRLCSRYMGEEDLEGYYCLETTDIGWQVGDMYTACTESRNVMPLHHR